MWFSTAFYASLFLAAVNAEELASETISPENTERDEIHTGCIVPEQPIGGSFELDSCTGSSCNIAPGKRVPSGSRLTYRCDENDGYILKGDAVSSCHVDKWHLPPTCIKYCPALSFENVEVLCLYERRSVSCNVPTTPGTKATLACKDSYKILPMDYDPANREITCLDEGVWSHTAFQCVPECGMAVVHGREVDVNGRPNEHGNFPWNVAIYKKTSITTFEHICAGTLVSPDLVISAARCFFDETLSKLMNASEFSVVAGKHYRPYNMSEPYSQRSAVETIHVTEIYFGASQNYEQDIALVRLDTPFVMTTSVRPVCMDWYNSHRIEQLQTGSIGMTACWGRTTSGSPHDKLQELRVFYIPFEDCLTAAPENFKHLVTADKFCGGHLNGSRSCAGDKGAGLFFQLKGVWFLRGVISVTPMSNGTCDKDYCMAFTNVGPFLDWIRDIYLSTGNGPSGNDNRASTSALNYNYDALVNEYGGCPWRQPDKHYSKGVLQLHEEVEDFFTYIGSTMEEHKLRLRVIKRIEDVIHDLWPNSKVDVFGSFGTGLYLPTSDIDLAVSRMSEIISPRILAQALLDRNITEPVSIEVIDKTEVPIVRLSDKESKIQVDISFNNQDGVESAEFIKSYRRKFPALEKLVLVFKQFLSLRDLNTASTGGIPSYAIVLMTINFLQLHPKQNANCSNSDLGILLIEFLKLYGREFNYVETCMRLRDGGARVSKKEVRRDLIDGSSPLCIEDPLPPNVNKGRGSYKIFHVKEAFDWAYSVLSHAVSPNNTLVNNAHKVSILGRIIRVKDDVVEYRKWIKESFPLLPDETDSLSSSIELDASSPAPFASDPDSECSHGNFP